jgi:hypothetical protein
MLLFELEGAMWRLVSWNWELGVEGVGLGHRDWTVGRCFAGEACGGKGQHPVLRMGISAVTFRREVSCAEGAQRRWGLGNVLSEHTWGFVGVLQGRKPREGSIMSE